MLNSNLCSRVVLQCFCNKKAWWCISEFLCTFAHTNRHPRTHSPIIQLVQCPAQPARPSHCRKTWRFLVLISVWQCSRSTFWPILAWHMRTATHSLKEFLYIYRGWGNLPSNSELCVTLIDISKPRQWMSIVPLALFIAGHLFSGNWKWKGRIDTKKSEKEGIRN